MPLSRSSLFSTALAVALAAGCASAQVTSGAPTAQTVTLPSGAPGIGFDDLRFSAAQGAVLVPAGRSGNVDLVDPASNAVTTIGGFSAGTTYDGGHDFGVTSVDAGGGLMFATDRTSMKLDVIDPGKHAIVGGAALAASPDYVRWVGPTSEVWVTEPDSDQIEVFTAPSGGATTPVHAALIKTTGGPESLVIDATRGRAYTHLWSGSTLSIDLKSRAIVATWPNGCSGSRGIDLDEARGFLFAGCSEGTAVVLDVAHDGKQLSTLKSGAGVDVIAYNKSLGHLYLPGASSQTMAILGVSPKGALSLLGVAATAKDAHCVTADASGNAYVCDPDHGQLLKYKDAYPISQ